LRLEIVPHNKLAEKHYGHGVLSPEAAGKIRKALEAIAEPALSKAEGPAEKKVSK
jgi:hypothetical protein